MLQNLKIHQGPKFQGDQLKFISNILFFTEIETLLVTLIKNNFILLFSC